MTARRAAADRDEVGVAAVIGDVLLDPGEGLLHVDDVCRPLVFRADAVADGYADPAAVGKGAHQRVGLRPTVAEHPPTAGNLQQHRGFAVERQVGAAPDVGQVGAVRTVLDGLLVVLAARQHGARDTGQARDARIGRVARTDHVAQWLFERRPGTAAAADDEAQDGPGDHIEHQRDSAAGTGERAAPTPADGGQHRGAEHESGRFTGRPAIREGEDAGVPGAGQRAGRVGGVGEAEDGPQQGHRFTRHWPAPSARGGRSCRYCCAAIRRAP